VLWRSVLLVLGGARGAQRALWRGSGPGACARFM